MFPYLDLAGFSRRTLMPAPEVAYVENDSPGFIAGRIAARSSYINGLLRKRYGSTGTANSLPFGQNAPALVAAGTAPPAVSLSGRPMLGSLEIGITITGAGPRGTATFRWTTDGISFATGTTGALVALGYTGLSAVFGIGSYGADNAYAAATPCPEAVLGWLVTMVTYDCYRRRGVNPQDPQIELLVEEYKQAIADLRDAANSKDGLFDLPSSEDANSAVTTGGPLGCSQASPYVWTDIESRLAGAEDNQFGGACDD